MIFLRMTATVIRIRTDWKVIYSYKGTMIFFPFQFRSNLFLMHEARIELPPGAQKEIRLICLEHVGFMCLY